MFDAKLVVLAKDINEAFAHIAIDAALDGIIDGRYVPFDFKENVKEPF